MPEIANATYNEANQVVTFNDKTFSYDRIGNITSMGGSKGTTSYAWDARNRLVAIDGPGLVSSFKYDALNRRIEKTINGKTIYYLYDGKDIILEIENGITINNYLRGLDIDEVIARGGNGDWSYFLFDG